MGGWVDGWLGGWEDGWIGGWVNGWLGGWMGHTKGAQHGDRLESLSSCEPLCSVSQHDPSRTRVILPWLLSFRSPGCPRMCARSDRTWTLSQPSCKALAQKVTSCFCLLIWILGWWLLLMQVGDWVTVTEGTGDTKAAIGTFQKHGNRMFQASTASYSVSTSQFPAAHCSSGQHPCPGGTHQKST
jgi:hypothetical protein